MIFDIYIIYIVCIFVQVFADPGVGFISQPKSKPGWAFQGRLLENTSTVDMVPELMAVPIKGISTSMSICGYTLHHDTVSFFPFVVLMVDKKQGFAEIKLKSNVARDRLGTLYTFQIEAYDCDMIPHFSQRKFVLIEIKTSQRPIFSSSSYHFLVKLGTAVGTKIGTITAFERPEKMQLGSDSQGICKYAIMSPSAVPFNIDALGSLTTKVLVLDGVKSKRYRFQVKASDCNHPLPRTNLVSVMVDVFNDCSPHWTGLVSSVEYNEKSGVLPIVSSHPIVPALHLCSDKCQDLLVVVNVKLEGKDVRPASSDRCRHDSRSLQRQKDLCDVSKNGVDLLAMAPQHLKDNEKGGFYFSGNVEVKVDTKYNGFGHSSSRKFNIMFWMKHADQGVKGLKEQIICNSDGQVHNRHHLSLFLHNCKLILLLRKEYEALKEDQFQPAEWRYGPLKEVCDDKWHHYAVMYNDGAVFLQIDGEMSKASMIHLDDKPLAKSPPGKTDTRFSVGACYHAKLDNYVQHFEGHLASLNILDGELEAINNIRCIATCGEALLMPHIVEVVGIKSSVTLFSESVTIRSHDIYNLLMMFSGLSYINTEIFEELQSQQVANRTVSISTEIHCDGNQVSKADPRSIVILLKSIKPRKVTITSSIRISTRTITKGYPNEQIALFRNMKFINGNDVSVDVESCIIRPVGRTIMSWEYIDWPINLIINLHLTGLNNSHGLVLEGKQELRIYELVLAKIYYVTSKYDANELERRFAVSCSMVDKSVMDETTVSVFMKQPDLKTYYVVDDPDQNKNESFDIVDHQGKSGKIGFDEKEEILTKDIKRKVPSTTIIAVIMTGVGLVVVVVIVAIVLAYKKIKRQPIIRSRKVFMNDNDERQRTRMHVITNPLLNGVKGGGGEVMAMADDMGLFNDVPDSEEEEGEEEEEGGEEEYCDEDNKEGVTIPGFLRIPSATHCLRSVDV